MTVTQRTVLARVSTVNEAATLTLDLTVALNLTLKIRTEPSVLEHVLPETDTPPMFRSALRRHTLVVYTYGSYVVYTSRVASRDDVLRAGITWR